jgi:hypothetical protein
MPKATSTRVVKTKNKTTSQKLRTRVSELPQILEARIGRFVPAQNIEKWQKVSNCGYFLRNSLPYTADHLAQNKNAFNALKHSVVKSLTIFKQRVSGLRMYGGYTPYLHYVPCYTMVTDNIKRRIDFYLIDVKSTVFHSVEREHGKYVVTYGEYGILKDQNPNIEAVESLIDACKEITVWKNDLRTIDSQMVLFYDIVDRFQRTLNVAEFESAASKANFSISVDDARSLPYKRYWVDVLHDHQYLPEVLLPIEIQIAY